MSKEKRQREVPSPGCRHAAAGSPWDRFQEAIKVVIRNLGGTQQFLLASGYVPSEWVGSRPGFWVSPHNPNIMWKAKDAINDHFTRFRWHDRAEAMREQYQANAAAQPPLTKTSTPE